LFEELVSSRQTIGIENEKRDLRWKRFLVGGLVKTKAYKQTTKDLAAE
jgi:hypothetical protein